MRHSLRLCLMGLLAGMAACHAVRAADLPKTLPQEVAGVPEAPSPWVVTMIPYAWATSVNGRVTVRGRTTDVDAGFIEILDHTQFPRTVFQAAGLVEARNGEISLFADVVYAKFGIGANETRSRSFSPDVMGTIGASVGVTARLLTTQLGVGYEVARWPSLMGWGSDTALDLYAGTRIWVQRVSVDLSLVGTATVDDLTLTRGRARSRSGEVAWADPVLGMRFRHAIKPGMDLVISGDVGGFGVGSQFSWQALGALQMDLFKTEAVSWGGMIGYRALYVDYEQGYGLRHYRYDVLEHGPLLGVTAKF